MLRRMNDRSHAPWWREWPLALAVLTLALALSGKGAIASALDQPALLVALLAVLCGVILAAAIAIVRHADVLAHRLGEPAGTLLLTLAVTAVGVPGRVDGTAAGDAADVVPVPTPLVAVTVNV